MSYRTVNAGPFPASPELYITTSNSLLQVPALEPNATPSTLLSGHRYSGLDYYAGADAGYLFVADNSNRKLIVSQPFALHFDLIRCMRMEIPVGGVLPDMKKTPSSPAVIGLSSIYYVGVQL